RIAAARDPQRLPRLIVQQTRRVFQAEGAALVVGNRTSARVGRLPVGLSTLDGRHDLSDLLGPRKWTAGDRSEHWIGAPVRQPDAIGVLAVWRPGERFDEFEQTLFEQHAARVGIELYDAEVSAREHEVAVGLQQSLLPRRLPSAPHVTFAARYFPARAELGVGGDWYDAIELNGDEVAFSVGDVMGHGVGAAALMGQLRIAVRAYAAAGRSPASVLAGVDRLLQSWEEDCLVTVAYAVLGEDGSLRVANAGHPPPLIIGPDGSAEFGPPALSVPLGVDDAAEHHDRVMQLVPGSTVLLYTDGLVELPDVPVDRRLARLQAAAGPGDLSPDERCDRVLAAMVGDAHRDDVSLLAARWLP
ncbi:MAG: serine/threonine-protein phosphatase, partial [Acidimicrobiaceae bacterium]|nr:serine/threonine-protein phosphatase [Acidimicrobiaceae bacterium]